MTTLAEDKDSWRASGILRRDFRHTHGEPEVPRHRRHRSRNSRKWCRRKVGRAHGPLVHVTRNGGRSAVDVCSTCGKQVNWYWYGWT